MKTWARWTIALVLLLLVAGGVLRTLSARKAQQDASALVAVEVGITLAPGDTVRAATHELVQALPISGTLRAVDWAVVKARVAGELSGLTVREGDSVSAGQVIARIDPVDYQSRVRQAQEQADSARAQAEVAQRTWDNNRALVDQGFISKTALDTSQSNLNAALATHRAALAAVDMARKALGDTVLKSPITGQVAQRLVQPGERVSVDTRVLEVVDLSRIELEASIGATDSVAVQIGQRATLQIEGRGTDTAGLDPKVGASVVRVNPSAQAGSRSVLVYLRLDRSTGFRQGLFAQGTLDVGRSRALALPLSAVRVDRPAPYVQLVEGGRITHRAVTSGLRGQVDGQTFVTVSGLEEGAVVVAGSIGALREGTPVRLPAPAPAAAGTPRGTP